MKILLVDEDGSCLETLSNALDREGGHTVFSATSAADGFQAVGDEDDLDILVTAALMAPQDGFHLRLGLRARFPDLRVAFVSKTDLSRHLERIGGDIVFYKPIDVAAFLKWVGGAGSVGVLEERFEPEAEESAAEPAAGGEAAEGHEQQAVSGSPTDARVAGPSAGAVVGDYELIRLIGETPVALTFEAMQKSVQRRVAFTMLRHEVLATDPGAEDAFLAEVRAKAAVVHRHVAPVYETLREGESVFYTRELVEGKNLGRMLLAREHLDPGPFISLVQVVAESLEYFHRQGVSFSRLRPEDIYIGVDGQARLVNIALAEGQLEQRGEPEQVRAFGAMVAPLAGDAESERDTGILNRLVAYMESGTVTGGGGIAWSDLSRDARAAAMELEKGHVREMPGLERRARRENFRRKLIRLSLLVGGAMMVGLVFRGVLALVLLAGRPEVREFNEMIRVPAGSFVFQDETRELDAFWIDEYEVTVAQYAEFLEALGEPPLKDFDHPDQPPEKSAHVPPGWAESYRAASRGKFFHGHRIDLNSPVSLVDWWDAFAYAKWKGRRLPTEEEWEKAARGRVGNIYPWGDEFVPTHLNSSEDYAEDPMEDSAGTSDGYAFWSPVDAHPLDISEYSVLGLAGNVSEWTASWSSHPEYPDRQVPVKRGGSFATRSGYELALRRPANSPEEKAMTLGFRTASSTRPED